jgi:hypothetical protein
MTAKANPRNHRNNPYILDGLAVQVHHSAAGTIWRFRTEAAAILAATAGYLALHKVLSLLLAAVVLAVVVAVLMVVPWSRRFVTRRAWCVLSRHRIQRVFYETRMHTVGAAVPGAAHPSHRGRRTRRDLVPGRDLLRGLRSPHRRTRRRLLRPRSPRREAPSAGAARRSQHRAPRHPRRAPRRRLRPGITHAQSRATPPPAA